MSATPTFGQLLNAAHDFADLSGKAVLKHFRRSHSVDNKSKAVFDPVTEADRAAELAITRALRQRFPGHALTGEEYGHADGNSSYRWIVDPIDGTRAFIMGSPLWGTLIGLLDGDTPVLGLMDQPFTGERFWSSEKGAHMRRNGGRSTSIRTRACPTLSSAIFTSTHPGLFESAPQQKALAKLNGAVRLTRYGGDCYGYCLLAAGFVDLIVEPDLKTYDIAPLIPIIERAGGVVTTWDGGPATNGGDIVASGDKRLHDAALDLLSEF